MNGEPPNIPITTLAGIASLTELLPNLPLPTPLVHTVSNKSLFSDDTLAHDAQQLISSDNELLAQELAQVLQSTSTSDIDLKDNMASEMLESDIPVLLQSILRVNPDAFHTRVTYDVGVQLQKQAKNSLFCQRQQQLHSSSHHLPHPQDHSTRFNPLQPLVCQNQSGSYLQHGSPYAVTSVGVSVPVGQQHACQQYHASFNGDYFQGDNRLSHGDSTLPAAHHGELPASSPAQATSAEGVMQQQQYHQLNSQHHSTGHMLHPNSTTYMSGNSVHPHHGSWQSTTPQVGTDLFSPPYRKMMSRCNNLSQLPQNTYATESDIPAMLNHCYGEKDSNSSVILSHPRPPVGLEDVDISDTFSGSFLPCAESARRKTDTPVVMLEMLDSATLQSISSGGSVKAICDNPSQERSHSHDKLGYSIMRSEDGCMSFQACKRRAERSKGVKRKGQYIDDCVNESLECTEFPNQDEQSYLIRKRKKERHRQRQSMAGGAMSSEELMDSHMFRKFSSCVDYVFDTAEDVNFHSLEINDDATECPPELLISKGVMADLCGESAKLKSMNVMNQIPPDRLVRIMTILLWNIKDGTKVSPFLNADEDEEESRLWREVIMERIMRSMDASLSCLAIMTSPVMHKMLYLEDVIERMILFVKFQLHNSIYPDFDPVYRVDHSGNEVFLGSLKSKRARSTSVKHKSTILLYNKMCLMIGWFAELLVIQEMTDTIILQMSYIGVSAFFVENISELQLNAMKLVTTIFSNYGKHRQLILEDIFSSLARLPSTKRNLRNFRLNSDESIQMVTALALQLIQCVVTFPSIDSLPDANARIDSAKDNMDKDDQIVTTYATAMRTAYNFLTVFLNKCTTKGDEDYRPLFENFVQDLLSTVNKPEWPSSELLLSLLGRILVHQFSSKSVDTSLRVASLEYLGIVAARLRKDAVSSHMNKKVIDDIVLKVSKDIDEEQNYSSKCNLPPCDTTQSLQESILEYLAFNARSDSALQFARQFYIGQWYRDAAVEVQKKISQNCSSAVVGEEDFNGVEALTMTEMMQNVERRKNFLISLTSSAQSTPSATLQHSASKLDYDSACLVARYLSSKRPFSQSFDVYLTQILKVLSETSVAVRTKAMKCLTAVLEADPGILARVDMQRAVHGRFLDQSTSVREAAVELVGKFILIRPELVPKYYDMLSDRILDTGISVRKRVIKIFRDICIEHPDYDNIPEMCVKMIRRVNDEEGIKKLVNEVFQSMWFSPVPVCDREPSRLLKKVMNISDVVAACKDTGYEFFEQLLENLLKKDEDGNYNKTAIAASTQIVDCLVENVLRMEEKSVAETPDGKSISSRLIACLSTLHLFCKIKPELMVSFATTLQPYLDIKCNVQNDYLVLHYVARILELVVPLVDHPSESFLVAVEEDMIKLILKHGMMVVQSCVSCLGAIVNGVSHNFTLVKDCFGKFFGVLSKLMLDHKDNAADVALKSRRPTLLRSLFTVGQLARHFDFDSKEMGEAKVCVHRKVFDVLFYFIHHEEDDVQLTALTALGFFLCRHYDYMLAKQVKDMYQDFLVNGNASVKLRCQVLKNLQLYLVQEEISMSKSDAEWRKHAKAEDLKEMGDVQSGMASTVVQMYLRQVLESFIHEHPQVRITALNVLHLILRQGLVHPVQCMSYLICMSSDPEPMIRVKADQQLEDIEKKYPGFMHMKAFQGIKNSYRLQQVLHKNNPLEPIRGFRQAEDNQFQSLNGFLYSVLRSNRSHRRGLLTSLLNLFDDTGLQKISMGEQVYVADNMAYFPFQVQDEALFVVHQIDIIVSVAGSNLMQSFKENLLPKTCPEVNSVDCSRILLEEDDDDNPETLINRLPDDISRLQDVIQQSQGCILLLVLKQHLKDTYSINDSKIHRYSPTEVAKVFDKPLTRKSVYRFMPQHTLDQLRAIYDADPEEDEKRQKVIDEYLEFRDLMMIIDPMNEDDSADEQRSPRAATQCRKSPGHELDATNGEHPVMVDGGDNVMDRPADSMTKPVKLPYYYHKQDRSEHRPTPRPRTNRLLSCGPKSNLVSNPSSKSASAKKRRKRRKRLDDCDSEGDPDFVL